MAGEHARVADRVVDLRDAAGVAVEQGARGAARRRELGGLLAGADLLLDLADHLVDAAGVDQRALGGAGVARLERGRDPLERAAELAEHRLGEAAGGQRGVGREEQRADGERDGAADGALGDAGRREAALGRAGVERHEQDCGDGDLDDHELAGAERGGAVMASTTSTAICQAPVPITEMSSVAMVMPSTTPPTSWKARPVRWPCVTPTAITAAIAAKAGRGSGSSAVASSHAAIAAVAFCTIGSMRPRRRERAVSRKTDHPLLIFGGRGAICD